MLSMPVDNEAAGLVVCSGISVEVAHTAHDNSTSNIPVLRMVSATPHALITDKHREMVAVMLAHCQAPFVRDGAIMLLSH